ATPPQYPWAAKLRGNWCLAGSAAPALGAEGHAAMACGLRRASASGVPRGQPPPWRGARGAEPARISTHRAGGTGSRPRPEILAGSARGGARSHLHAPCRWYWFEATPRDLGGEREGRSPLARLRNARTLLMPWARRATIVRARPR